MTIPFIDGGVKKVIMSWVREELGVKCEVSVNRPRVQSFTSTWVVGWVDRWLGPMIQTGFLASKMAMDCFSSAANS